MDLVYVTSRFPFGPGEAFLGPEISAHLEAGANLRVFPMWAKGGRVHAYVDPLLGRVDGADFGRAAVKSLSGLGTDGRSLAQAAAYVAAHGSARVRRRNLAVLPRAAALVAYLRSFRPAHLHVHWGGASSTVAMIAAEATGTPWSMTVHRWDIRENNLLARKIGSACFTRVISDSGAALVAEVVPQAHVDVIHMGVRLRPAPVVPASSGPRRIACIAGLVPVKDHRRLLAAFAEATGGDDVALDLVGDGPMRAELGELAARLGISDRVRFLGMRSHQDVLRRLEAQEWAAVVLTSTSTADEQEGIPVSLMEAMAAGVPVVATDSGGTRELLGDGAGIVVPLDDETSLVEALRRIVSDDGLRAELSRAGRERVAGSFDVDVIASDLRRRFAECSA